jgi:putative ABC transport system substrate-binding protein
MKRRQFFTFLGYTALWPAAAHAQQPTLPVVGFLGSESPARSGTIRRGFRHGLAEVGYVEDRNFAMEYRWADSNNDRLPGLATDLVRQGVTVIAAPGTTPAALAVKMATTTVPAVFFTAGDPAALGLVASLSRPGGNLTGITSWGALLHQLVPRGKVFAALINPTNPSLGVANATELAGAAQRLGVRVHIVKAGTERELEGVFPELAAQGAGGLVITVDSFFTARRERLGTLALQYRVPTIYQLSFMIVTKLD